MQALFADGNLVRLFFTQQEIHEYVREFPAVYQQRHVYSLVDLDKIVTQERERYDIVHAIIKAGEVAAYNYLYSPAH